MAQEDISAQTSQDSSEASLQQSSEDSLQQSSEESSQQSTEQSSQQTTQQSTEQSSQQTSQNSTENSFQYSTDQTSASFSATTDDSSQTSEQSAAGFIVVVTIAGAVVGIGLTAVGVTSLVRVAGATQENILAFQDEIYAAAGVEYANVLSTFDVDGPTLVHANDELVTQGYVIESDYDAAKYLGDLIMKIAGGKVLVVGERSHGGQQSQGPEGLGLFSAPL